MDESDSKPSASSHAHRWELAPLGLLVVGVVFILCCALAARATLGWWWLGIVAGAVVAVSSAAWMKRRLSEDEQEQTRLKRLAMDRLGKLETDEAELKQQRQAFEQQMEKIARGLQAREEALANRLVTYHEWMEFPKPLDLSDAEMNDGALAEMAKKDRQLLKLLEAESKLLFDKIRNNEFLIDGVVQPELIRDETYALIDKVIAIYQPGERRLLDTSLEQIFRSISRASIQFMVAFDEAPIDVKQYNLQDLYNYVQQGVKYYGYYKKVEPYWPYLNSAYYAGRFVMGANPIVLGAWWVLGSLSARGVRVLAEKVVNRHALLLLHNLVRVIGFETAAIYGGEFRHRDANWIYGAELTELVSRIPPSHEVLTHALKEIGALQLRNEYDRIFLYRAAAVHQSARPDRYRARVVLSAAERRVVAERLERFQQAFGDKATEKDVNAWRADVEHRLGVQLKDGAARSIGSEEDQQVDCLKSLASFLLAFKECEPEDVAARLEDCELSKLRGERAAKRFAELLEENPPFFFEHPDVTPGSDLSKAFLRDLANLAARQPPYALAADEAVIDAAAWLRVEELTAKDALAKAYNAVLSERLPGDAPRRKAPLAAAQMAVTLLENKKHLRFLYDGAKLHIDGSAASAEAYLLGADEEALLFSVDLEPRVLWRGDKPLTLQRHRGMLASTCEIVGGSLLDSEQTGEYSVRITGAAMSSFATYFKPLIEFSDTP